MYFSSLTMNISTPNIGIQKIHPQSECFNPIQTQIITFYLLTNSGILIVVPQGTLFGFLIISGLCFTR